MQKPQQTPRMYSLSQLQGIVALTILIAFIVCIIVWIVAHSQGEQAGMQQYLSTCMHYPFLLLDPGKYVVCPLPTP